jgi:hypothetical protein
MLRRITEFGSKSHADTSEGRRRLRFESKVVFREEATLKCHEADAANAYVLGALQWRAAVSPFYRMKSNNTNGYLRMLQSYSATQTEGLAVITECPFPK